MEQIADSVRSKYGAVAKSTLSSNDPGVQAVAEAFGYSAEELRSIPARGRRAPPLLVHFERRKQPQFEEFRLRIQQQIEALSHRQTLLPMLRFDGLCTAALANLRFLTANLSQQRGHLLCIGARPGCVHVELRRQLGFQSGGNGRLGIAHSREKSTGNRVQAAACLW
jgi:hypothetical protein